MKNLINYYYNLFPTKIMKEHDYYYFFINNKKFLFKRFYRNVNELKQLVKISNNLFSQGILVNTFIMTKSKNFYITEDDENFVLLKVNEIDDDELELRDIVLFSEKHKENTSKNASMINIWKARVDAFESQVMEYNDEYPNIQDTFNYYIGLAENAILYANNVFLEEDSDSLSTYYLSHNRFKNGITTSSLYDPLSFILDYEARDISEYIKIKFFNNEFDIEEIEDLLSKKKFSKAMLRMLYAKLLYPNYYFDLFENIISSKADEKDVDKYRSKSNEYEDLLFDIYVIINKYYKIPEIDWIMRKNNKNMV